MSKWVFERESANDESPYKVGEHLYLTSGTGLIIRGIVVSTDNGKLKEIWIPFTKQIITLSEEVEN